MARKTIDFVADTVKFFAANPRQLAGYQSTIQNNTGQSITITVTNNNVRSGLSGATYAAPAVGALVIVDGAIGSLNEAYQAWTITAAAPATGAVTITEMG